MCLSLSVITVLGSNQLSLHRLDAYCVKLWTLWSTRLQASCARC